MPSRKRPKQQPVAVDDDPVKRFAAGVRADEERERARRRSAARQRDEAEAAARRAAEHAAAVATAEQELRDAIEGVRAARRTGRGAAEADARWKQAKARVIELETGSAPAWAPPAVTDDLGASPEG